MSINIFQFLKQGTSLNRQTLKLNQSLEGKIAPLHKKPNLTYHQSGKFRQADESEHDEQEAKLGLSEVALTNHQHTVDHRAKVLRKSLRIKVEGIDVPEPVDNFTKMSKKYKVMEAICVGLAQIGLEVPTAVQMQAIPALLEEKNILVTAPTGTGKTLAYLIPLLQHSLLSLAPGPRNKKKKTVTKKSGRIQSIVLVPFQELSVQVKLQLQSILPKDHESGLNCQCISDLSEAQKKGLESGKPVGVDILISTPMSFINTFGKSSPESKPFEGLKYFIMDECDKYFEESFIDQIKVILELVSSSHPTYGLFSATIQHPVEELLKSELLEDPIRIEVGGKNRVLSKVVQQIEYCTNQYGKLIELKNMISENRFLPPALIFVQEKSRAKQLYFEVRKMLRSTNGGMDLSKRVEVVSGDKDKEERQRILDGFSKGDYWVLITTDLVARGIDFLQVNLVINYDFPNSMLTYIHRVGRTGRADRVGTAITFFTEEDKSIVRSLANLLQASGCTVPGWILTLPKPDKKLKRKLEKHPTKRLPVGMAEGKDKDWEEELEKMEKRWAKQKAKEIKRSQEDPQNAQESNQWIQA